MVTPVVLVTAEALAEFLERGGEVQGAVAAELRGFEALAPDAPAVSLRMAPVEVASAHEQEAAGILAGILADRTRPVADGFRASARAWLLAYAERRGNAGAVAGQHEG